MVIECVTVKNRTFMLESRQQQSHLVLRSKFRHSKKFGLTLSFYNLPTHREYTCFITFTFLLFPTMITFGDA